MTAGICCPAVRPAGTPCPPSAPTCWPSGSGCLTLYWFAPDTSTSSTCTGSCAIYWPPVSGSPTAGPGVTGRLGTIKRSGGGLQATYDGHPLYTYIGDRGPGQANGNDLDLNGGFWYDIRVPANPPRPRRISPGPRRHPSKPTHAAHVGVLAAMALS